MNFNFYINTGDAGGAVRDEAQPSPRAGAEVAAPMPVEQLEAMMGGRATAGGAELELEHAALAPMPESALVALAEGPGELEPLSVETLATLGVDLATAVEPEAPLDIAALEAMSASAELGTTPGLADTDLTPMPVDELLALGSTEPGPGPAPDPGESDDSTASPSGRRSRSRAKPRGG